MADFATAMRPPAIFPIRAGIAPSLHGLGRGGGTENRGQRSTNKKEKRTAHGNSRKRKTANQDPSTRTTFYSYQKLEVHASSWQGLPLKVQN
jgi:hypothetical protein